MRGRKCPSGATAWRAIPILTRAEIQAAEPSEAMREDGTPSAPDETGRVLVTPLHNLAMPLIRYDIGGAAEVGAPCPCGRGLPVLTRILG